MHLGPLHHWAGSFRALLMQPQDRAEWITSSPGLFGTAQSQHTDAALWIPGISRAFQSPLRADSALSNLPFEAFFVHSLPHHHPSPVSHHLHHRKMKIQPNLILKQGLAKFNQCPWGQAFSAGGAWVRKKRNSSGGVFEGLTGQAEQCCSARSGRCPAPPSPWPPPCLLCSRRSAP